MENKDFEMTDVMLENEEIKPVEPEEVVEAPVYVEKSTLELPGEPIALIMYKPKTTLLLAAIFTVAFILMGQLLTILLGIFIMAFALFVQFAIKDYPTLEIYPDFTLVYKLDSLSLVRKVKYEDVEEWSSLSSEGKTNAMMFKLNNGEVIYKDTFCSSKAYRVFKKLMGDKESRVVAHRKMEEKNKNIKFKFRFKLPFKWPFKKK